MFFSEGGWLCHLCHCFLHYILLTNVVPMASHGLNHQTLALVQSVLVPTSAATSLTSALQALWMGVVAKTVWAAIELFGRVISSILEIVVCDLP